MTGSSDAESSDARIAAQHKAARREVARRLHPDVGGDPDEYMAALTAVDRKFAGKATIVFAQSRRTSLVRSLRSVQKRLRRRRYTEL